MAFFFQINHHDFLSLTYNFVFVQIVASILQAAAQRPDWVRSEVLSLPASGSMLLYQRKDGGYYKQVGENRNIYIQPGTCSVGIILYHVRKKERICLFAFAVAVDSLLIIIP